MYKNEKLLVGKNSKKEVYLLPNMANRHGLITGASGSGKTITLKVLAESFSEAGIPVFLVDVKGDLAGTAFPGVMNENIEKRVNNLNLEGFELKKYPVTFYDVYGKNGHPIRATVKGVGLRLLSKMLDLTDTQEEILGVVFKISEDEKYDLINLDNLDYMLAYVNERRQEYSSKYGNISTQSITSIKRAVINLMDNGGDLFFGEPSFDIKDFRKYDEETGYGYINILDAQSLFKDPTTYTILLLWLLTTVYNEMDEVGDLPKPRLVFFIDEAHLIFSEMKPNYIKQLTQIVKLIRSKGVGLYFISQSPSDITDEILSQLGNRVQHVLRSYTKTDEKAIMAAANSFRKNSEFDTAEAIRLLGTGEALVSFQTEKGEPDIVEKVTILPPQSRMGTISDSERQEIIKKSRLYGKYEKRVDSKNVKLESKKEEKEEIKETRVDSSEELTAQERLRRYNEAKKAKVEEPTEVTPTKLEKKVTPTKYKKKTAAQKLENKVVNKTVNKATTKIVNYVFNKILK